MKQLNRTLVVLAATLAFALPAQADTVKSINVSTDIDAVLDMKLEVFKYLNGSTVGGPLNGIPFGTLVRDEANWVMRSADAYVVFLSTNSSSRPYTIKSTMPPLSNGTATLPAAMSMAVMSASTGSNFQGIVGDSFQVGAQNAIMDNKTIYTSDPGGTPAWIQILYGISGGLANGQPPFNGWQPVLLNQPSGSYTSSITYSMALV